MTDDMSSQHEHDTLPWRVLRAPKEHAYAIRSIFERTPRLMKRQVIERIDEVQHELDEAQERARVILEQAHKEAVRVRQEGHREGMAQGVARVLDVIAVAKRNQERALRESEQDMIELAFGIASKILGHQLLHDSSAMRSIVMNALEHARGRRQIIIFVHPDALPDLERAREALERHVEGVSVVIDTDEDLALGDCCIETEAGRIDARLTVQLNALRDAMLGGSL